MNNNIDKLLESNKILMSKIEQEIDDSENDINDIDLKQNEIKNINNQNNYYLKRITDFLFRLFKPKLFYLEETLLNNNKTENNSTIDNEEGLLEKSKKIGKKLDKQNEKLDEIINNCDNNFTNNQKNIDLIKKLV